MYHVEKVILVLSINLLLFVVAISGCMEKPSSTVNIQDMIDNIPSGGILYIDSGIYHGNITLNKSIILIGENKDTTIIDGNGGKSVVVITADNCTFQGFTVTSKNSSEEIIGIDIYSSNNIVTNNTISHCKYSVYLHLRSENNTILGNELSNNQYAIYLIRSSMNNISKNDILLSKSNGIKLESYSNNNELYDNKISNNLYGLNLVNSYDNKIFNNNISDNQIGIDICCSSKNNIIYNNLFINNNQHNAIDKYNNSWDGGSYGNYWDDYKGTDENGDGIGDMPYDIPDGNNQDRYPLMNQP